MKKNRFPPPNIQEQYYDTVYSFFLDNHVSGVSHKTEPQ